MTGRKFNSFFNYHIVDTGVVRCDAPGCNSIMFKLLVGRLARDASRSAGIIALLPELLRTAPHHSKPFQMHSCRSRQTC